MDHIWRNPKDVAAVNHTDICLIPKVEKPEFVTQFRPISLCNSIYKFVTKMIVNSIISDIVSPYQAGFVPGRNIHENIITAQEMMHSMHRMQGKKGFFAIKVDLARAYDRLSWDFIHGVLLEIGLLVIMIDLIMECISSVKTNVIWGGSRSVFFSPTRGIRQGDPVSPYIFVLCMDKLSHLIMEAVEEGSWHPLKAGKNGPLISHLMFADDLLLFGQATRSEMEGVNKVLDRFCAMSGQQVSREKTSIMFSRNVAASARREIAAVAGFREVSSFGKYLGIPLSGKAPKKQDFGYLVDKIRARLTSWKANNLSFAGRLTLAKAVIEAIPQYPMMSGALPSTCLKEIQKIQRGFIWGQYDEQRKIHHVK